MPSSAIKAGPALDADRVGSAPVDRDLPRDGERELERLARTLEDGSGPTSNPTRAMLMRRVFRPTAATLCIILPLAACGPRYQPRQVPVPSTCEPLLDQATTRGLDSLAEAELRQLAFCQQQHLLRAEEEQAAYARFEAGRRESAAWFTALSLVLSTIAIAVTDSQ